VLLRVFIGFATTFAFLLTALFFTQQQSRLLGITFSGRSCFRWNPPERAPRAGYPGGRTGSCCEVIGTTLTGSMGGNIIIILLINRLSAVAGRLER
jgi:hypothetical protein